MKRWLCFAVFSLAPLLALAQAFPERPVRIIVPLTPGGSPDTIARAIAQGLSGVWTQPVVVENRTGGSQNIGSDLVAKSPPDGYTWLLAPDNVFSVNPYLGKQPFDPLVDLMPVTQVARIQFLLVVNPDLPAKSVPELIALAKAKPGELNFGSSGNGSPQHLGATMFQLLTGTKMNHVPYKGAAPAVADLLPGRIQVWIGAANTLLPHIKEGKLRLLGDTPTIAQSVPGYSLDPWLGLFVPAKTPQDVVMKIHGEVV
jgi:tripartite-type tricarboxylate transporter receptor subunit TctC